MLYATLVSWDMNSRGAKMKYFDDFKVNIKTCLSEFKLLETIQRKDKKDINELLPALDSIYRKLDLMKTNSKLVSNSKMLHFLYPTICMPMDRKNTLEYFYGNPSESRHKYLEIIQISHEIGENNPQFSSLLDNNWNTTIPKMIDNAIILIRGISVK